MPNNGTWWHVYAKVNVSEIGDSPEEIQRKKDEEEAARKKKEAAEAAAAAAKKKKKEEEEAEREKKQLEEALKRNLETENKFYEEYPTLKKSDLKDILKYSFHHLPSARTEAQKLLDIQVAEAQAAQKKLEEEQKAAAEALAAVALSLIHI